MNPVVWFFVDRPGLVAGLLPVLLLTIIWAVSAWLQRRALARERALREALPQTEGVWPPPPRI